MNKLAMFSFVMCAINILAGFVGLYIESELYVLNFAASIVSFVAGISVLDKRK